MLSVWMDVYKDIDFVVAAAAVNPPHKMLRKWRLPISRHFLMGNAALSYQIYPLKRSPPKCLTDTTKQLSSGLVNRGRKVKNNAAQLKKSFLVVHYTSSYEREFNALLSVPFSSSSPSPKLVFQKGRKRSVKNGAISKDITDVPIRTVSQRSIYWTMY